MNRSTAEPTVDGLSDATATEPQGPIDPNIEEIQKAAGIELFDGDEELSMLDRSNGEAVFFASIKAACEAKKLRLNPTQGWEHLQAAHPAPEQKKDLNPPGPTSGMDFLSIAHDEARAAAAEAAKPNQNQINEMWLRYWRSQGPRPPKGTMYKE
jgi:hypothetical protein